MTGRVSPNRPAPPERAQAPRPPRYRRAGCGAERKPHHVRQLEQRRALVLGKSTLRTDQDGKRRARRRRAERQRPDRRPRHPRRKRSDMRPRSCSAMTRVSATGSAISGRVRMPHCSAASMALARMRAGVDARDLAVAGEHGLQPRNAHLDRLLHHVVEPRGFQRREQIVQVGGLSLGPGFAADMQHGSALLQLNGGIPLAVAAIEDQHAIIRFEPQHRGEVMRLRLGRAARARPSSSGPSTYRRIPRKSYLAMILPAYIMAVILATPARGAKLGVY